MPTYDYRCAACGHQFEEFQSIKAPPLKKCPACGRSKLARLIGTGAGIIFKGSGFYETDYRSESYKKAADAEKKSTTPAAGGESAPVKTDATPTKSEAAKPAAAPAATSKPAARSETKKAS